VSLVLDASLTLSWYFEDERTPASDIILDQVVQGGALVPALWRLEVANGLQMAIRRRRIAAEFRDRALGHLGALAITRDPETDTYAWSESLRLADCFGLTIYDATYLELAQRRGMPLATLDVALHGAGRALCVPMLGRG
jgi:predicted nucleic acid-binding protein